VPGQVSVSNKVKVVADLDVVFKTLSPTWVWCLNSCHGAGCGSRWRVGTGV
jgi:hypothetical protein